MKRIRVVGMVGAIVAMAAAADAQEFAQIQVAPVAVVPQAVQQPRPTPVAPAIPVPAPAPPTTVAAPGATVAQATSARLRGFSVVLLLGEAQGSATPDGLAQPARKALADIKDFLPYRGYRVLDTQWIAGTERSVLEIRLQGVDSQEYIFSLETLNVDSGGAINAHVSMSTPGVNDATRAQAMARIAQLENFITPSGRNTAETQRELAQLKQLVAGGQNVIRTYIRITAGETIVVGTSRVQGDKALVVLLTAVPR